MEEAGLLEPSTRGRSRCFCFALGQLSCRPSWKVVYGLNCETRSPVAFRRNIKTLETWMTETLYRRLPVLHCESSICFELSVCVSSSCTSPSPVPGRPPQSLVSALPPSVVPSSILTLSAWVIWISPLTVFFNSALFIQLDFCFDRMFLDEKALGRLFLSLLAGIMNVLCALSADLSFLRWKFPCEMQWSIYAAGNANADVV